MSTESRSRGFALPTVMIASIVMLMVLLSGLVSASSTNAAIRSQYQDKVLAQAVQSGVAMANACMSKSNQIVTWSNANPLRPNTDCNGTVITAPPVPSQYIVDTTGLKTTFTVNAPVNTDGTQRASVIGKVINSRTAGVSQERTSTGNALVGGQPSFNNIAFGYCSAGSCGIDAGVHFAVVLPTGEVRSLGRNSNGRLGNGTTADAVTPVTFALPSGESGAAAFSNFLSTGKSMAVLTASGKIYSAGTNNYGQLGVAASAYEATPRLFSLPAGNLARFAGLSEYATYVITSTSRMYAAGSCTYGVLGTGPSCATTSTPTLVALPTPTSDPNTQPETDPGGAQATNLNIDRLNVYVRMKGGAVYGWGANDFGQLGDASNTTTSTPKRIQALSSFATPSATQIVFGGNTLYLLDTNGLVWAVGNNDMYGQMAGAGVPVKNGGNTTICMQKSTSQIYMVSASCNANDGWQFMEFWPDKTLRFRTDSRTYGPTDSMLCATAPAGLGNQASAYVQFQSCTGAADQQWDFRNNKTIYNAYRNACLEPNAYVYMQTCNAAYNYQWWTVQNSWYLRPLPVPPGNPKATRISNDNGSIIIVYENGEVWGGGSNNRGQLGVGASYLSPYNPVLRKVSGIPAGRTVVDAYESDLDPAASTTGLNSASYNNTYFILDDGSVYGTGGNNYGQIGNGVTADYVAVATKMNLPAGTTAKSVQTGYGTTVVLTTTGQVYTVGNNSNGQLGDGTTTSSSTPKANRYTNQRQSIVY